MSAVSETPKSGLDLVKWLLVVVILSLIVVGNYIYELSTLEKAIAIVVLLLLPVLSPHKQLKERFSSTSLKNPVLKYVKWCGQHVRKRCKRPWLSLLPPLLWV